MLLKIACLFSIIFNYIMHLFTINIFNTTFSLIFMMISLLESKMNHFIFLNNTLSNKYIHWFMILLEYICFIFPSSLQAALKLRHFDLSTESFNSTTLQVSHLLLIRVLDTLISNTAFIIVFSISLSSLVGY